MLWILISLAVKLPLAACVGPHPSGDEARYTGQAHSLLSGHGFSEDGRPETSLPPGYPVFLAAVFGVGGEEWLQTLQVLLTALAAGLVASVLATWSTRWAA